MRRWTGWVVGIGAATGVVIALRRPGSAAWRRIRRTLTHLRGHLHYAQGRFEGAAYRFRGRKPDAAVTDNVLADRVRSSLGRTERELDLPHVHVMVERHVALLHGAVATEENARRIEHEVASVPGIAGVESYLHVGLGRWDTRPSEGRAVHRPSEAMEALLVAAEKAGVSAEAAPLVVRGVLATFADRLPASNRSHLASNLPADVRPLFTPPRRIRGAAPARSLRDLVGRVIVTTSELSLEHAQQVTVAVVHALRDLVPGDVHEVSAVLPAELRELWESPEGQGTSDG